MEEYEYEMISVRFSVPGASTTHQTAYFVPMHNVTKAVITGSSGGKLLEPDFQPLVDKLKDGAEVVIFTPNNSGENRDIAGWILLRKSVTRRGR